MKTRMTHRSVSTLCSRMPGDWNVIDMHQVGTSKVCSPPASMGGCGVSSLPHKGNPVPHNLLQRLAVKYNGDEGLFGRLRMQHMQFTLCAPTKPDTVKITQIPPSLKGMMTLRSSCRCLMSGLVACPPRSHACHVFLVCTGFRALGHESWRC